MFLRDRASSVCAHVKMGWDSGKWFSLNLSAFLYKSLFGASSGLLAVTQRLGNRTDQLSEQGFQNRKHINLSLCLCRSCSWHRSWTRWAALWTSITPSALLGAVTGQRWVDTKPGEDSPGTEFGQGHILCPRRETSWIVVPTLLLASWRIFDTWAGTLAKVDHLMKTPSWKQLEK